jgi:hypothetical protein
MTGTNFDNPNAQLSKLIKSNKITVGWFENCPSQAHQPAVIILN